MSLLAKLREDALAVHKALEEHLATPPEGRGADFREKGDRILADAEEKRLALQAELDVTHAAERLGGLVVEPNGQRLSGVVPNDAGAATGGTTQPIETRSLGLRFAEAVKAHRQKHPGGNAEGVAVNAGGPLYGPESRAVIYGAALAADMVRPLLVPGIVRGNEPLGVRAMRDVLLGGSMTSDAVTFIKENVFTNAAATVAEATSAATGAKPESSLTFTQVTVPAEVIAHWIPITRQALDDTAMLQSYVEGRLIDGLRREENDQLLNGDGTSPNISGILDQSGLQVLDQTYFTGAAVQNPGAGGPENYNRILRAMTLIMTTGDSVATFIVVNPTDLEVLLTLADTTDQYFGQGPFAGSPFNRTIWGLQVVVTEDLAAGSYVVGDGTAAQVWDRWAARILIADQHSDFFIRNLIVLLAEERLALAVYRPAAFALVDAV